MHAHVAGLLPTAFMRDRAKQPSFECTIRVIIGCLNWNDRKERRNRRFLLAESYKEAVSSGLATKEPEHTSLGDHPVVSENSNPFRLMLA